MTRDDILSAKVYFEPEIAEEFIRKYKEIMDPDVKFDYLAAACEVGYAPGSPRYKTEKR